MFDFPDFLRFEISEPIDTAVTWLLRNWDGLFDIISRIILIMFNGVETVLNVVPWWLYVVGLLVAGWKLYNVKTGLTLSAMLIAIGLFGLWELMIYTLVIVIISVIVSVLIGLPTGIFMAKSENAKNILMPILDAMQTLSLIHI